MAVDFLSTASFLNGIFETKWPDETVGEGGPLLKVSLFKNATWSVLVHVKATRRGGNWSLFLLCDLHNHKMAIGSSGEEPFELQVAEHLVPSFLSRHGRLEAGWVYPDHAAAKSWPRTRDENDLGMERKSAPTSCKHNQALFRLPFDRCMGLTPLHPSDPHDALSA